MQPQSWPVLHWAGWPCGQILPGPFGRYFRHGSWYVSGHYDSRASRAPTAFMRCDGRAKQADEYPSSRSLTAERTAMAENSTSWVMPPLETRQLADKFHKADCRHDIWRATCSWSVRAGRNVGRGRPLVDISHAVPRLRCYTTVTRTGT